MSGQAKLVSILGDVLLYDNLDPQYRRTTRCGEYKEGIASGPGRLGDLVRRDLSQTDQENGQN